MNKKVLDFIKKGLIPPEVRTNGISNSGELYLGFTKDIVFPSNLTAILNDKSVSKKSLDTEHVKDNRTLADDLINKSLLTLSLKSYVNDTISDNLTSWTVTSTSSRQIIVKFTLSQPLLVSQGD